MNRQENKPQKKEKETFFDLEIQQKESTEYFTRYDGEDYRWTLRHKHILLALKIRNLNMDGSVDKTERFFSFFSNMIAEWVFFLYKTGQSMLDATTRPHLLTTVCHLKLSYNVSMCNNLDQFPEIEDELQGEDGRDLMYYRVLISLPGVLLGLAFDSWIDKCSCRMPLLLPCLTGVLTSMLYMLSLKTENTAILWILLGALVQGFFEQNPVIFMEFFRYSFNTENKDDTTRQVGKLIAMNYFGLFTGALLAGLLQDYVNLTTTYFTTVLIYAMAVLFIAGCMLGLVPIGTFLPQRIDEHTLDSDKNIGLFKHIRMSFLVLAVPRKNKGRETIIILFCLSMIHQTCTIGQIDAMLLFVTRTPFHLSESWYGYMLSLDYALTGICLVVVLPILSKICKLSDISIMILGLMSKTIRLFLTGFISETWMLFASIVVGSFGGMITSAIRSIMTKTVENHELDEVFSLLAITDTVAILTGTILFVSLYTTTAHILPGLVFIIEGTIYLGMLLITAYLYQDLKKLFTLDLLKTIGSQTVYGGTSEDNGIIDTEVVRRSTQVAGTTK